MRKKAAIVLACAMICTLLAPVNFTEAATIEDGTVTVSTQTGVNRYLDNENVQTMILKTERSKTITIPSEEGTEDKTLIIDAPNATIRNKADLGEIVVNDSRKYVEYASGNSIVVNDEDANIVLYKKADVSELTVNSDTALITVQKGAKAESIVCTSESVDITIDTASKNKLNVTVPEGVEPVIEGTYASKVKVAELPIEEILNDIAVGKDESAEEESVAPEEPAETEAATEPEGTGASEETAETEATTESEGTGAPEEPAETEATTEPEVTAEPEVAEVLEETVEPEATEAPVTTPEPEVSVIIPVITPAPVPEFDYTRLTFTPAYWIEGIYTGIYSTYEFAAAAESQEDLLLILTDYKVSNPAEHELLTPVTAKKTYDETERTYTIRGYDVDGKLAQRVVIFDCYDEMGIGDGRDDYFYDINKTVRVKREYFPCYATNEDGSNRRVTIIIEERHNDAFGNKIYYCLHNTGYIITILYDEEGNEVYRDSSERVNGAFSVE